MFSLLSPLKWLPIIELVAFYVIGGRIGFFYSLMWVLAAAWVGYLLLQSRGRTAYERAAKAENDEIFAVQDMFDGFCIYVASILLIFPGFVSDFIAVLILIPPVRHAFFTQVAKNPNHPARHFADFAHTAQKKDAARKAPAPAETIEAEYRKIDEE